MQHQCLTRLALFGLVSFLCYGNFCALAQESPPVSAQEAVSTSTPEESVIYLPYQNLKQVFEKHGATMLMPFDDYLRLWQQTVARLPLPDQPPVGGVISKAAYTAKVEQDLVRIQAKLEVLILKEGWVDIPVSFGDAAIASVTGDPGPVLLRGTGNGAYALMFSKSDAQTVQLELTARVRTAPEGRSFDLQIPNVGITSFELTVPDADQSIELQPKLLQESVSDDPKVTQLRASLGSTSKVTARWHPRVGTRPDMELLASATNATLVSIEDGLIHADAHFQIEVLRGQLEQLRVAVPKGQRVLDVTSAVGIKEWTIADEAERQVITVALLNRQGGKIPLEVHTESTLTGEPFDAAGMSGETAYGIHLLDVLRESGQIAIRAAADLQLNVTTQQGLARIDESEADARIKKPGAAYFRFYTPECRLSATAKPLQPRLTVDHAADVIVTTTQLRLHTRLQYTIERAGLFELTLGLPEGMTVENVTSDYFKDYHLSDDGRTLTVTLREGRQGPLKVDVILTRPRDPAAQAEDFPIPLIEPRNVEVETGHLRILAPDTLEIITDPAGITGFQPDQSPNTQGWNEARLVSAWTFNRRPLSMPARTVTKPTRLTATVATTLDVQQGQTHVTTLLSYNVQYAGLNTFRFSVPEAVADAVQIHLASDSLPPIRQKSRGQAIDGRVIWTVLLQREFTGNVALRLTYDLEPAGAGTSKETTTASLVQALEPYAGTDDEPAQRMVPLTRITGEVSVKKDRVLSVSATADGGDVEPIDIRELQYLPADGIAAFRYYQQPVTATLLASKYDVQNVLETVVARGLAEVVLDRTGVALVRTRYKTKSSERQRLRIDLPEGIEPLGAELDGKSIPLEKNPDAKPASGWEAYYVNVARTKTSDETFQLTLQYRHPIQSPPFQTRGGSLNLRLPVLGGTDSGVPVQQFRVAIWIPNEFALVGTPNQFERLRRPSWQQLFRTQRPETSTSENDTWIGGQPGGVFDFPTEGQSYVYTNLGGQSLIKLNWWYLPFYTWIVSGTLVIIAVVLRNTTWENKLTCLIVAAFMASAYALKDADLVLHGLAVASYGLVALLAIWILHGLLQFSKSRRNRNQPPPGLPPAAVIPPPGIFDMVTLGMHKS